MIPLKLVREALRQSYDVKRLIGRGGMAAVYLAVRLEDGDEVAVKLFDPSYQMTKWSARFHREIELLQQLHHPSIQPLINSGEVAHLVYYVMPVADGGSLDGRMRRNRRHSLAETLEVVQPVAAALDYAHEQNVVHRDIKPGNILFHKGQTRLCDFGIARAIRLAGGDYLTSIGVTIGTPTYMSPQQAAGERELLDGRSDVYSLACVVYELLVGEPLFSGSDQNVIAKHIKQPPPSPRVVRPDLPQYVEDAIQAALAKQPDERPGSAGELVAGLGGS